MVDTQTEHNNIDTSEMRTFKVLSSPCLDTLAGEGCVAVRCGGESRLRMSGIGNPLILAVIFCKGICLSFC